ncbi:hypothetical protein [Listeria newyorkensis]|uniref:Uncharacterized protein n=1 Tax=Listeria newyorkensis TaxID=1497681 RepID=A0A841YVA2_9LIST|nr:hypothetical protein [Listeria newyorkensis]MBC1457019.1 hypothetical protein [Listeria newyorkensis]
MDLFHEIRQIEVEIAKAILAGADATVGALKSQKTEFERQLQLAALKRNMLRDANHLTEDSAQILHGKETMFDDWGRELTRIQSQLGISFESKTGDAISSQLQNEIRKLCTDREADFQELKKSCKVNIPM